MTLISSLALMIRGLLRPRLDLALENMVLRQQLAVLNAKTPRPKLHTSDRIFWIFLLSLPKIPSADLRWTYTTPIPAGSARLKSCLPPDTPISNPLGS